MSTVLHHFVARGMDLHREHGHEVELDVPKYFIAMVGITIILFSAISMAIHYTYSGVVATLAMVESPTATAILATTTPPADDDNEPDAPLPPYTDSPEKDFPIEKETPSSTKTAATDFVVQELFVVKSRPITASVRGTLKHLRSRAGPFSRFRGAHVFVLYAFVANLFSHTFRVFVGRGFFGHVLTSLVVPVLLSRVATLWVHLVISEPSSKRLRERMPPRSAFKKLVLPTLAAAIAADMVIIVPSALGYALAMGEGEHHHGNWTSVSDKHKAVIVAKALAVVVSWIFMAVCVYIPADVALTRVQASLLPEGTEAIVPFDRTFGGKVVSEAEGGKGKVSMRVAWKTFDWNSRVRLAKVYAKSLAMQTAFLVLFVVTLLAEVRLVLGPQVEKMIRDAIKNSHNF